MDNQSEDFDQPPPQYPGDTVAVAHPDTRFQIPSFDDVMALYEFEDSIRLPTYSARPIRRYHPYLRLRPSNPSHLDDTSRYYNTIFDESYVALEVPPLPQHTSEPPSTAPINVQIGTSDVVIPPAPLMPPPLPPLPSPESGTLREVEAYVNALYEDDQHQRRVRRLWYLLPEFVATVMHAVDVANQAGAGILEVDNAIVDDATDDASSTVTTLDPPTK